MSAMPNLILEIDFFNDHIETIVRHSGEGYVYPEVISGFLRNLADQIDDPNTTQLAKLIKKDTPQMIERAEKNKRANLLRSKALMGNKNASKKDKK